MLTEGTPTETLETPPASTPDQEPAPAATETPPASEAGGESDEVKALREELAELRAKEKAAERAKLSEKEKAAAELAETRAETAKLQRDLEFTKAGVPSEITDLIAVPEGTSNKQAAAQIMKAIAKAAKALATKSGDVGAPINPASGETTSGKAGGEQAKSIEQTVSEKHFALNTRKR